MDMNITFGTCSIPYGPSAATRTIDKAGSAALISYYREMRGLPIRCCRGGKGTITTAECVARYQSGDKRCINKQQGHCSRGALRVLAMMEAGDDSGKALR